MRIIEKIVSFIRNIFNKSEDIKELEAPNQDIIKKKTIDFIEEYKTDTVVQRKRKKAETLVCEGDGLGIQPKISY